MQEGPTALRFAGAADARPLAEFSRLTYAAAFGQYFSPGDLEAHLAAELSEARWHSYLRRDCVLLVEINGRLAGYLQFGPADHGAGVEFRRVYVDPGRLGQGVGGRMLAAVLDLPDVAAAPAVWIEVWEENHGARRLYERFGFVATGERGEDFVTASGEVSPGDLVLVRRRTVLRSAQP